MLVYVLMYMCMYSHTTHTHTHTHTHHGDPLGNVEIEARVVVDGCPHIVFPEKIREVQNVGLEVHRRLDSEEMPDF